ncbi:MAG: hypothetical protein IT292_11555 [Deltaproteobacteria bacterium]|nr:hypothetical protein [Deltaproteobacteria bacterium]
MAESMDKSNTVLKLPAQAEPLKQELSKATLPSSKFQIAKEWLLPPKPTKAEHFQQFAYENLPFIIKQEDEEEEEIDGLPSGVQQSDLMSLEIKKNLSQMNMPKRDLKQKNRVKGLPHEHKTVKQHSAVIFELIRTLAHFFPWLLRYIAGVFVMTSTKQK